MLHRGTVVERGPTARVLDDPQDPYTQRLRASVPRPGWKPRRRALTGAGEEPTRLHERPALPARHARRCAEFRARELSPVELVTAVIERAEAVEPVINAFAETFFDQALEQARAAEARYAGQGGAAAAARRPAGRGEGGGRRSPASATRSGRCRCATTSPTRPAAFVQRIIDAGGIVHARTTTPEFSCAPVTWTKLWGVTRNPWNTQYSPGGSSGGSAASLAAGTATLATGSDIGGSIRIPASFCGVVGFKPPYGRVPEMEIFNLDHYCHEGPLARTVADCALLENVIAGPHPSDVASLRPEAGDTRRSWRRSPGCGSRSRPTSAATGSTRTWPRTPARPRTGCATPARPSRRSRCRGTWRTSSGRRGSTSA